jgi:DNA-directed RNA polymerase specialized sigma24 family protein
VQKYWLKRKKDDARALSQRSPLVAELNRNFGDLVYDLYYSILWNHQGARALYLSLWHQLDRELAHHPETYKKYSRAWVLQLAVDLLIRSNSKLGRALSPSEQVMLDANLNIPARLRQFDSYMHKLGVQDQILLLLRDKYGLPYSEVAATLQMPEGSLRVKHQQALRSLEEWLWDRT